jgi:hypothetical protein
MRKAMRTRLVRFASCGLLMALSVTATHALPQAARAAPLAEATATQDRFCYSWLLRNNTAEDVNGVNVNFADPSGSGSASDVYAGPDNPFTAATLSSSINPSNTALTAIKLFSGSLAAGDVARVGFCNRAPNAISPFVWTTNDVEVQPQPRTLGLQWEWSTPRKLRVRLANTNAETMTVTALWLYEPPQALETADLAKTATSSMQLIANLSEDALSLAPNSTETFDVQFGPSPSLLAQTINTAFVPKPDQPFMLETTYAPQDDLSAESSMLVQGYSPRASYLPVVLRQL